MEIKTSFKFALTPENIVGHVAGSVNTEMAAWRKRLINAPNELEQIETEVIAWSREALACPVTAALLMDAEVQASVAQEEVTLRWAGSTPLREVYQRPRIVRFLCGIILTVTAWYCVPQRTPQRGAPRGVGRRGREGTGMYPAMAALGVREGVSPALASETARLSVLLPSLDAARVEMGRRGASLDIKTQQRVTMETGSLALAARRADILAWRRGEIAAGRELHGKRVAVAIDGGRARTRVPKRKGRKPKRGHRRYDTPWREPKLMTIYVLDEDGAIDRAEARLTDGTLQGPDHLMELVAYHLHRLGAAEAEVVVFLGDGADWIWDRVEETARRAGVKRWHGVVDMAHALGHVMSAFQACKDWTEDRQTKEWEQCRRLLRRGRVDEVIGRLGVLARGRRAKPIMDAALYLDERRAYMHYGEMRKKRLPTGSGAVESAIRRVINLRLKSPGMFWLPDHVEAMMYLRAAALTNNWDNLTGRVRRYLLGSRDRNWKWDATPMYQPEAEIADSESGEEVTRAAA